MPKECADCGASLAGAAELVRHMEIAHRGGDPTASLSMNLESDRSGLACALCGQRFSDKAALAQHDLSPHFRTNLTLAQVSAYQALS